MDSSSSARSIVLVAAPARAELDVRLDTAVAQQVACIVEPGGQIAVVELLLHQAILHRPVLLFQLGGPLLQLLVFIFQMAQARLELADRRAAGQKSGLTGTTRRTRSRRCRPHRREIPTTMPRPDSSCEACTVRATRPRRDRWRSRSSGQLSRGLESQELCPARLRAVGKRSFPALLFSSI